MITSTNQNSTETIYLAAHGQPDSVKTRLNNRDYWLRYRYTVAGLLDSVTPSGATFSSRKYSYHTAAGLLSTIKLGPAVTRVNPIFS